MNSFDCTRSRKVTIDNQQQNVRITTAFSFYFITMIWILVAEDTLWTGIPGEYTDSKAPEVLSEVRKLVDDGRYGEATTRALGLSGNPTEVYHSITIIFLQVDFCLF